jgi:hypothetical protein
MMDSPSFHPLKWDTLLGLYTLSWVVSGVIALIYFQSPPIRLYCTFVLVVCFITSFLQILWKFKKIDIKMVHLRVCIDSMCMGLGLIAFYKIDFIIVALIFSVATMLQAYTLYVLEADKKYFIFIGSMTVLSLAVIISNPLSDFFQKWLFISVLITWGFVVVTFVKQQTILKRLRAERLDQLKVEKMLLKHNFGNMASIVYAYSEASMDDEFTHAVHKAIDIIKNVIEGYSSDVNKVNCRLKTVVSTVTGMCIINNSCNIQMDIPKELYVSICLQPFMHTLMVFINNSCEAGASTVDIGIVNNNLIIADDGCGFDTKKIKPGYTTKKNGHGLGLVGAIEACKTHDIDFHISSKTGKGTMVCLNLEKVCCDQISGALKKA